MSDKDELEFRLDMLKAYLAKLSRKLSQFSSAYKEFDKEWQEQNR